jgi:hypothetical protein
MSNLSKPDPRASAILFDELDAGCLKCGPDGLDGSAVEVLAAFKARDCRRGHIGFFSQFTNAKLKGCARHPALCGVQ